MPSASSLMRNTRRSGKHKAYTGRYAAPASGTNQNTFFPGFSFSNPPRSESPNRRGPAQCFCRCRESPADSLALVPYSSALRLRFFWRRAKDSFIPSELRDSGEVEGNLSEIKRRVKDSNLRVPLREPTVFKTAALNQLCQPSGFTEARFVLGWVVSSLNWAAVDPTPVPPLIGEGEVFLILLKCARR